MSRGQDPAIHKGKGLNSGTASWVSIVSFRTCDMADSSRAWLGSRASGADHRRRDLARTRSGKLRQPDDVDTGALDPRHGAAGIAGSSPSGRPRPFCR